ncbi:MAG TPA: hypothetical protein VHU82_01080 [Vicinamibacterales bacterium]|jgi:hypothetical protein|nr:hypothetical protein [Vicinamibacterales bacterium]
MKTVARVCLCGALVIGCAAAASAQEPKSAALAKQLAAALDAGNLDSIAAKDPSNPDTFIGVLYFKGVQLLAVSAKYSAPALLVDKLSKKDYKNIYIDLNSASMPDTKVFIEDLGADGLKAKHDDNTPFDTYEAAGKRTAFDGDWKKQKLSEQEYMKIFAASDERYSQMLTALLAQLRPSS